MSWHRWLAGSAVVAGALAAVADRRASTAPPLDVEALAQVIAREEDHVSAPVLAGWLREGRPGLRVLDLRTAEEYRAFHLPGAEHLPLEALATARFRPGETLVLYSGAGIHAGQAWVFLRALGHQQVFSLRHGVEEWTARETHPRFGRGC